MWLLLLRFCTTAPSWAAGGPSTLDATCVVEPSAAPRVEDERDSTIEALVEGQDGTAAACVPSGVFLVPRPASHQPPSLLATGDCHALGALDAGRLVVLIRHPTPSLALVDAAAVAGGGQARVISTLALTQAPPAGVTLYLEGGVIWLLGSTGARSPLAHWDGAALSQASGSEIPAPPAPFPPGARAPDGAGVLARRAIPTRPGWAELLESRQGPAGAVRYERTLIGPDGRTHMVYDLDDLVGRVACLGSGATSADLPARDLAPGPGSSWVQMIPVSSCTAGARCVVFVWLQAS